MHSEHSRLDGTQQRPGVEFEYEGGREFGGRAFSRLIIVADVPPQVISVLAILRAVESHCKAQARVLAVLTI